MNTSPSNASASSTDAPRDFREEVARAAAAGRGGDLALFSYEAQGFGWEAAGRRLVAAAQSELKERASAAAAGRVLVFTGHMIDAAGRERPRFPAEMEPVAREKIREAVAQETTAGVACAYAGGASGGDIIFHEVCEELGVETRLYLAVRPPEYVAASVEKAGGRWVERFRKLYDAHAARGQVRVLSDAAGVKDESEYLPAWLRAKEGYGIWQRNNLWMLFNALDEARRPDSEDPNITLIALWDGEGGDGAGGTGDLIEKVTALGARRRIIDTKRAFGLD